MWTQEGRRCQEGLSFDRIAGSAAGGLQNRTAGWSSLDALLLHGLTHEINPVRNNDRKFIITLATANKASLHEQVAFNLHV